ncbi:peptide ABC transporter, permease protein [Pseudonocardia sp. Ae406_Ps2]|uniref:ABC transporter permease n=1 Tax=unclassified Pseudonocardia TaxID=2619320 RepID=UPI00094B5E0E|nr:MULTISPECIES: ABC transporter permease [unclassified Pseudonocardia]OLL98315.1 peptide ABC transporter, permease protein [Pseudonocardia sp. Ae331_Ps2]OLM03974.1 peptide ABC transporter, permease protein [Pseudonocardia sp. Ae406_Ps2]OLM11199.1 peptide ABC transporter, permease protein [Pseudonocardia sp. Ae505_Ps2]OLM25521.1 peptide ABC transporter, permease protein [Pseudonocardia sp. Ae706_Ps2]OLM34317.1 peptide ABC transporter, permease protein [Pseudonocardia sp. Ae717_Ps2]
MTALVARRLLALPLVAVAAAVLVFLLPRFSGQDTALAILRSRTGESDPDPSVLAALREQYGLDGTWWDQFTGWAGALLRGDLGISWTSRTPVSGLLWPALGVSLTLTVAALVLAALVGIPLGVRAARRPGGRLDRALTTGSVLGVAIPEFVLGTALVLAFAVTVPVLPATGWGDVDQAVLPVVTLAAFPAALAAQLVRAETVDALARPHVAVARSKGISDGRVLWRHGGRLALTSVTSLSGLFLGGLLGGSVVVEVLFAIPGLGRLLYDAVLGQDLPVVQAGLLAIVLIAAVAGILAELLALALDPVARSAVR